MTVDCKTCGGYDLDPEPTGHRVRKHTDLCTALDLNTLMTLASYLRELEPLEELPTTQARIIFKAFMDAAARAVEDYPRVVAEAATQMPTEETHG